MQDLVVCGTGAGILGGTVLGDAAPAPGSSSAMGLGIFGLYFLGSPDPSPPPIIWILVRDEPESACL
jgi:hypothetical protein